MLTVVEPDVRDAFFDEIYRIGAADPQVVFLTADMDAFSLRKFKQDFPKRFINAGVAEQNMICVASGLAASGKKVFVYGINTFVSMRCFEQIKINICSMKLPVVIIGAGAGFSFGHDGPTHHGTQDVAVMRALPEMEIWNPADAVSAAACAKLSARSKSPLYIRLDKGKFPSFYSASEDVSSGFKILKPLKKINILSTGYMTQQAMRAAEELKGKGMDTGVVDVLRLKPLSEKLIDALARSSEKIVTLEEHCLSGGLGSILCESLADRSVRLPVTRLGIPDRQFLAYGNREWFHETNGLDVPGICKAVQKIK